MVENSVRGLAHRGWHGVPGACVNSSPTKGEVGRGGRKQRARPRAQGVCPPPLRKEAGRGVFCCVDGRGCGVLKNYVYL